MPRRRAGITTRNAYRALARVQVKAEQRTQQVADDIVDLIAVLAPRDPDHARDTGGPPLWKSYYVKQGPDGDFVICCRRRYWIFVEFGTREHGDAQPHVRPALAAMRRINT